MVKKFSSTLALRDVALGDKGGALGATGREKQGGFQDKLTVDSPLVLAHYYSPSGTEFKSTAWAWATKVGLETAAGVKKETQELGM